MLTNKERRTLRALAAADGAPFTELVRIAGLDPAHTFRGADLHDVDFGESDLFGYDFTEADLSGANLERASIRGAIFVRCRTRRTRWPRPPIDEKPPARALNDMQRHAAECMLNDLESKRRALVLMPLGTGRSAVLEEVIFRTFSEYRQHDRALLLVNTVAEREDFARRLSERLGFGVVTAARTIRDLPFLDGVIACNATYRELGQLDPETAQKLLGNFGAIFTTSLEKVVQLERAGRDMLSETGIGAIDSLPIASDRPDRRQFIQRMHRLFGEPSFVYSVEDAVGNDLLRPVHILQISDRDGHYPEYRARKPQTRHDLYDFLSPIADQIARLVETSHPPSLFVLAKNDEHISLLQELLHDRGHSGPGMVTRLGGRWNEQRLAQPIDQIPGIVLASVSRQSMEAARRHSHVVVAATLSVARAQDLAYRPRSFAGSGKATIYDLTGAFSGFPHTR